jgi:signal transduction histidine kinase
MGAEIGGATMESGENFEIRPDRAKLEALAEYAAGAGHEINNPLATIIGRAQLLLKDETNPQRRQMLMAIGAQAYRIRDMIGDTMLFARPPSPQFSQIDLHDLVQNVVQKQSEELSQENCRIEVQIPAEISLRADSTQLSIVISELLRNSRQSLLPNGGQIGIHAGVESEQIAVELTDTGKGFTDLEREHAFDPFFSGRQAGRGLGFGLCKCWRIVEQHSGNIEIHSRPGGPTTVRILLPLRATA